MGAEYIQLKIVLKKETKKIYIFPNTFKLIWKQFFKIVYANFITQQLFKSNY